ncbi:hypothetical protein [uncultured Polaribacter sp.]|uniref:hypothetical protein n=1 Tax=uncultured Polaribacter sp. TaxID=174711 RepID=UPI00260264EE|nr:hypothetical protein [uncultured Polaribacter sp.]
MNLTERYPKVVLEEVEENRVHIKNLWNDDSFLLRFNKDTDLTFLNSLYFPEELMASYSIEKGIIEVYAFPLDPNEELVKRSFTFNYKGNSYLCNWEKPTEDFEKIATAFREDKEESKTSYRNLRQFRDYYRKDELPDFLSKYFKDKEPFNFFIKGNFKPIENEIVEFCRHLNFYMSYFDRLTPNVQIFQKSYKKENFKVPCYSLFDTFPDTINGTEIDNILLEIITVANSTTDNRLSFIFYYQILEYASYYYLKSDIKHKLTTLLKKPDISYNSEEYSKTIIEEFKNHFKNNDDKAKLEMLISEHVKLKDLKIELEDNIEYFSRKLEFEGGFKLDPIMKNELTGIEQLPENTIKIIKENIVSIRNSLVHLRESRENKVILPTAKNDDLLTPYLYVLRRISEKIIIER